MLFSILSRKLILFNSIALLIIVSFARCSKSPASPPAIVLNSISISPNSPTITKGTTQQFTATGTYSDNSTKDITSSVSWSSGTTATSTITSGGLATGVALGTSVITASLGTISDKTTLTVITASLISIAITPANPSIAKGTSQQFTATGTYSDNSTNDITSSVTWSSGTVATSTISAGGLATGVAIGTSVITATSGTVAGNTTLTVTVATLIAIVVTPTNATITTGGTQQFTATGTYSDSSTKDITTTVTWNSGTTAAATITAGGLATGIDIGASIITATLGTVTTNVTLTVVASSFWRYVSGGDSHSLAIATDGTLWAWGFNGSAQLGDGTTITRLVPTQIGTESNWASVSAGYASSAGIKNNGTLWVWGRISANGVSVVETTPTQVGTSTDWASVSSVGTIGAGTAAIKTDGTLWVWSGDVNDPIQLGSSSNWASVSVGAGFTLAIKTDGTLWTWGINNHGQLGDGTTTDRNSPAQIGSSTNWASVSAAEFHSAGIKTDGTFWVWGTNFHGQHGDGSTTIDKTVPTQIGTGTSWVLVVASAHNTILKRSDGTLWGAGAGGNGQLGTLTSGLPLGTTVLMQMGTDNNWSFVTGGNAFTLAIKSNGTLWGCGRNEVGELGDGSRTDRYLMIKIK